ncbi:helix-turn-helix transcriptional regulator [Streptomyces diastatochromogenes]|uniref:Transcriptional regulator n=1 Tax=Streptomyces diastatochromogenes TaxID=42236 RepID=A0A233S9W6_STRDA|nr:helix-turn-helix transcriptional regulator [Streptomyces diastatochromogenes]MCZ0990951.1 helix-turn-helix transcriptional regulator [Streptomyces diastatochromogenes]OXY92402.1 transcriptional regulator [Streptomyces diastatochromogenes]
MDSRSEIKEFLASRRARITPQQAGLPAYGGNRRVPGLRREEVAMLAGMSVDYYVRLERGNLTGVSEAVLDSLARALQLDEAERDHLQDLARAANTAPHKRRRAAQQQTQVPPSVQRILDSMTDAPAFVRNGRLDFLAANRLGYALYAPLFSDGQKPPVNIARFKFLDPHGREFFGRHWEESMNNTVALLRTEAGRNPHDKPLTDLIGELVTRSEDFRAAWARHHVRLHYSGVKYFHHPVVGELSLAFDAMQMPAQPSLSLTVMTAEPGTADEDALKLLASWAATDAALPTPSGP